MAEPAPSITARDPKQVKGAVAPIANRPDIPQMSDDELRGMIALAEQELAARHEKSKLEFLSYVREQARALGFDAAEVAAAFATKGKRAASGSSAGDKRASVAPKYRNPANHAETWAGRGAKPEWVRAALESGKSLDDLKITVE